ncbi:unnamed protein product [Microthlaspi erraticum]|uniref:Uncharacterized protein n=1 Tax=Microthlaspi erraticum TaxID=1685480 RepID=A0A6D2K3A5_9BRAS|nr:unnamed protein product [Microthlaspi erraticum]
MKRNMCSSSSIVTMPKGEYLVKCLELKGPCKGLVTLEMNGNLKAPATATTGKKITDFTLNGMEPFLTVDDCAKTGKCYTLAIVRTDS